MTRAEWGALLRHWRGERAWMMEDLARRLEVSWRTVARWETGRAAPREAARRRIRLALPELPPAPEADGARPSEEVAHLVLRLEEDGESPARIAAHLGIPRADVHRAIRLAESRGMQRAEPSVEEVTVERVAFGRRLAAERHARGLTQAELAALLGVGSRAVREWERGRGGPGERAARAIEGDLPEALPLPRAAPRVRRSRPGRRRSPG